MQTYPRSRDVVWPGQLHGTGCLSARAVDTGFPTAVWHLCFGPGCGWVWVLLTPPVLAGVLGGCVWAQFVVLSLFCRVFVVFVVGLRFQPACGTCVVACALCLPPAVSGSGVRCGRAYWGLGSGCFPPLLEGAVGVCVCSCARPAWSTAPPGSGCCAGLRFCARAPLFPRLSLPGCGVWACVLGPGLGCAPPFLVGLSGCVFCAVFLFFYFACLGWALWCRLLAVPVLGLVVPVLPSPFFRAGLLALFFFSSVVCVCMFRCPFSRQAAVSGLVLPVLARWSPCAFFGVLSSVPSGWGVWPPLVVLAGSLVAAGCSLAPQPPPPVFFFQGGGGLPVAPSAFPRLVHALARIQCGLPGCCWRLRSAWPCSGPMGRVGYVHVGLGAPSCRVRSWLCRLGGCARRLRVALD